ncbi:HPr family phosphocarrier protein [Paenibacillus sp. 1P07SE]|uniref:HPr family phosphocarrier protein n=1 Tax=Paenibacillus sp. 1P07SE TaxID=3132209 RepID=UPI0039A5E744
MATTTLTIQNDQGFHVRPAQLFVEKAGQYESTIRVKNAAGDEADGKSMLELMTLGLAKGAEVILEADGADAEAAVRELTALIESKFGEG